jgi:hypothetical protein
MNRTQLTKPEQDELDNMFTYHKPFGDQPARYIEIRESGKYLAETVLLKAPASPERAIALRKIREAVQWANASIAINEREPEEGKAAKVCDCKRAEPAPEGAECTICSGIIPAQSAQYYRADGPEQPSASGGEPVPPAEQGATSSEGAAQPS